MKRGLYCFFLVACVALLILGVIQAKRSRRFALKQDLSAPDFALVDARGKRVTNLDLLGSKYGLIFVRAECDYCFEELKQLSELLRAHEGKVDLLLVSLSDQKMTERISEKVGQALDFYTASSETLSRLNVSSLPMLVLIDELGRVSYLQVGVRSTDFQKLIFDRFVRGESLTEEAIRAIYQP